MSATVFSALSGVLAGKHPDTGILCRKDGSVLTPYCGRGLKPHWKYGTKSKSTGYMVVDFRGKQYLVHRLLAETFLDNPLNLPQIDHKNRVRDDNRIFNICYASPKMQQDNTRKVDRGLALYGVRKCEDPLAYDRARYTNNQEYAERKRARNRAYQAKNAERNRARCREWWEKQKELGKRQRRCPDGKKRLLTDEEFEKRYGM